MTFAQPIDWLNEDGTGLVVSASRRWLHFYDAAGELRRGMAATKALEVTVGDIVRFEAEGNDHRITEILPRRNILSRRAGKKSRTLASNLDHLYIVTAVGPLLNPSFIDRIACVAWQQRIPCSLVVNKIDLPIDERSEELLAVYNELQIPTIWTTSKREGGLSELLTSLSTEEKRIVCLAGVSGVGKSSILNILVPVARRATNEVSERTGQGRQTTSQAFAYPFECADKHTIFIVDLPGVQNFGITHLSKPEVRDGIKEFAAYTDGCEYADCWHLAEPICGVKAALEEGFIAPSRYHSYVAMLDELETFREY